MGVTDFFYFYRIILAIFISSVCCSLWTMIERHEEQDCSQFRLCTRIGVAVVFFDQFGPRSTSLAHLQKTFSFLWTEKCVLQILQILQLIKWTNKQSNSRTNWQTNEYAPAHFECLKLARTLYTLRGFWSLLLRVIKKDFERIMWIYDRL